MPASIRSVLERITLQHFRAIGTPTRCLSGGLGLAERVAPPGEHLIKVILEPPNIRVQARELPHAVNLLVPMGVEAVRVALDQDLGHASVGVPLMGHAQLMVARDLVRRDARPFAGAHEVLRAQGRIPQDVGIARHLDELVRRHRFPHLVQEAPVVDAQRRRHAFRQPCPVLAVVAFGPFEQCGLASLELW